MDRVESSVCSISVLDDSFPNLVRDSEGRSEQAVNFRDRVWPRVLASEANPILIQSLIDEVKSKGDGQEFDSILGLSGGLDSSFMLHKAVVEWGLRPLVVHVDGGWNTNIASRNIARLVQGLSLDLHTEVIDWEVMRDFQLAWFRSGSPYLDIPQDHAFVAAIYKLAEQHGIKHILNGGNHATEGIRNPLKYFYYGTDPRLIGHIEREFMDSSLDGFPVSPVWRHKVYLRFIKGLKVVKPLNLVRFRKVEAETLLSRAYGWEPYSQKHFESRFTRFFEGYWLPSRFGFDPRLIELSSLVLSGQMSRETALERLRVPALSQKEVTIEKHYVSSKLRITDEQLDEFLRLPHKYYWDFPNLSGLFEVGSHLSSFLALESNPKK